VESAPVTFLVFGDLHGKVLPALRLAACWSREHARPLAGVLQVGDLGYFPDPSRMDRATVRHAKDDPLELGTLDVTSPNDLADRTFDDPACPPALWFTAGNHEDFDELERLAGASGRQPDFAADAYTRVRGIKDGRVIDPAGVRVAAVWGVDGVGANRRTNLPRRAYVAERAVNRLLAESFDVLLTHDAPAGAKRAGYGSEPVLTLIERRQPAFAFFGHYHGAGEEVYRPEFGRTRVFHMAGLELTPRGGGVPKTGSVGVLTWGEGGGFEFVPDSWLKTFTRHNWKHR
jgi:hypothetical protein